jgi:hypothetical protein
MAEPRIHPDGSTGNCYEFSARLLGGELLYSPEIGDLQSEVLVFDFSQASYVELDFSLAQLAHGKPRGIQYENGHAWVEASHRGITYCLDASMNPCLVIPKEEFYSLGEINEEEVARYSIAEAMKMITTHRHWGAWH